MNARRLEYVESCFNQGGDGREEKKGMNLRSVLSV